MFGVKGFELTKCAKIGTKNLKKTSQDCVYFNRKTVAEAIICIQCDVREYITPQTPLCKEEEMVMV